MISVSSVYKGLHLLPVCHLLIVLEWARNCCIVNILYDVISNGLGTAVKGHQGEEEQTEHRALQVARAQHDGFGGIVQTGVCWSQV